MKSKEKISETRHRVGINVMLGAYLEQQWKSLCDWMGTGVIRNNCTRSEQRTRVRFPTSDFESKVAHLNLQLELKDGGYVMDGVVKP